MKLERINENQIKCTLTREDLADRNIRISELAYGSEKTQTLFKDMMTQAHAQLGFDADNTPLMIEAIPVGSDSIMLVITKVDNPEELDSRFANFAPSRKKNTEELKITGADDLITLLNKLYEAKKAVNELKDKSAQKSDAGAAVKETKKNGVPSDDMSIDFMRLYSFDNIDHVILAASSLNGCYKGKNTLYKMNSDGSYRLVLHKSSCDAEDFNRICNLLSEYGNGNACSPFKEAHLNEHEQIVIANDAIQRLGTIR